MVPNKNQGYEIVKYECYNDKDNYIVLGYNPNTNMYVTWEYSPTGQFFWGHYITERIHALKDYHERLMEYYKMPF